MTFLQHREGTVYKFRKLFCTQETSMAFPEKFKIVLIVKTIEPLWIDIFLNHHRNSIWCFTYLFPILLESNFSLFRKVLRGESMSEYFIQTVYVSKKLGKVKKLDSDKRFMHAKIPWRQRFTVYATGCALVLRWLQHLASIRIALHFSKPNVRPSREKINFISKSFSVHVESN